MGDIIPLPRRAPDPKGPPVVPDEPIGPALFVAGFHFTSDDILAVRPDLTRDQAVTAGLALVKLVRDSLGGSELHMTITELWPAIKHYGGPE